MTEWHYSTVGCVLLLLLFAASAICAVMRHRNATKEAQSTAQKVAPVTNSPAAIPVSGQCKKEQYRLIAPVELHFTDSASRVGVRSGTAVHGEFICVANRLLADLDVTRRC